MKIATWNVNSLNVRLPHVLDWLATNRPDVLCLQETKMEDAKFPVAAITEAGYQVAFAGQKTYNGVALISKSAGTDIQIDIPGFEDEQKRVIAASYGDTRIICAYFPNGQSLDSDKYQYKLRWLEAMKNWLATEQEKHPKLALLGDYNIAPEDRDVHDLATVDQVLVSAGVREYFQNFLDMGFQDAFRLFDQEEKSFSWWDYRMAGFRRNLGLRIDHILLTEPLAQQCHACWIDKAPRKLERPSDHTPVVAQLSS
jgi:exodeoxyribonuclease III